MMQGDEQLSEYSENNFDSMIQGWAAKDRRESFEDLLTNNIRWWVKFMLFVGFIVCTAFWCGYFLSVVTR